MSVRVVAKAKTKPTITAVGVDRTVLTRVLRAACIQRAPWGRLR
ncbi:MAG: hypothetical protein N0A24_01210 [Armatimonadetes bacterium]|nr:hypothetical protein [Armatimonadota bacterium]MDW8152837.1 hypothetical protein [Armatimonadota bacterium]